MRAPAAACFMACLLPLSPVAAQNLLSTEEVVVTARRIAEPVDTVPLAIDVVSASNLGVGAVSNLQSLADSTPGLGFESLWGGLGSAPVLRGQSQPSTAGDNVGVFIDDIYQSATFAVDVDTLDMDRIEVVRGPQSALFGRSTFAGAIRYVPRTPTPDAEYSVRADMGSDALWAIQGVWSGPLDGSPLLGRLALSHSEANGTYRNGASDETLGGYRHDNLALTLMSRKDNPRDLQLTVMLRLSSDSDGHPPSSVLSASEYNCGGQNPSSGLWSYFCGAIPLNRQFAITTGLPSSKNRSTQVETKLEQQYGAVTANLTLTYYYKTLTAVRDLDDSVSGLQFGVCTIGISCGVGAISNTITRIVDTNVVSVATPSSEDWSQELRISGEAGHSTSWLLGAASYDTHDVDADRLGADRGNLSPNELLTAIIPATPMVVGPVSLLNSALVQDSRGQQVLQDDDRYGHRGVAIFGAVDSAVTQHSRARLEMRIENEEHSLDDRLSDFQSGFGTAIEPVRFTTLTPRISLDDQWNSRWYGYVSLARGSRSGGINPVPGLDADEQGFGPEYNWTTEISARYRGDGLLRGVEWTAYNIDWHDTQILGLATTPGVADLVTHNTAGVHTVGTEAQLQWQLSPMLAGDISVSWTHPTFRGGSDDPGSRAFCGLTVPPFVSSFCNYGPPREVPDSPIAQVVYLDGNYLGRTARASWNFHLTGSSARNLGLWSASWSAGLSHQGDSYERGIDGAYYGARTLLGAQLLLRRNAWQLALWGTNLTDASYIRAASSRGNVFYPTMPRPFDLIYGDGRRFGVTVSLER
jgi:iron complex outermembrane receptor protein